MGKENSEEVSSELVRDLGSQEKASRALDEKLLRLDQRVQAERRAKWEACQSDPGLVAVLNEIQEVFTLPFKDTHKNYKHSLEHLVSGNRTFGTDIPRGFSNLPFWVNRRKRK
jgi:hypothetical protein